MSMVYLCGLYEIFQLFDINYSIEVDSKEIDSICFLKIDSIWGGGISHFVVACTKKT